MRAIDTPNQAYRHSGEPRRLAPPLRIRCFSAGRPLPASRALWGSSSALLGANAARHLLPESIAAARVPAASLNAVERCESLRGYTIARLMRVRDNSSLWPRAHIVGDSEAAAVNQSRRSLCRQHHGSAAHRTGERREREQQKDFLQLLVNMASGHSRPASPASWPVSLLCRSSGRCCVER